MNAKAGEIASIETDFIPEVALHAALCVGVSDCFLLPVVEAAAWH
mgnify:CR=1 FL=1